MTLTAAAYRDLFPALERWAWFDTPGCGPGAAPVVGAVRAALEEWTSGTFSWKAWDSAVEEARELFAGIAGVAPDRVAALGSVAEGAGIVAASLPPGRIVVGDQEFRSVLFPWLTLDPARNPVTRVPAGPGRSAALAAAVTGDTVLVVASDTLTSDGERLDVPALRAAADHAGARLLLDMTQSFGVLDHRSALAADYLLVHGYKWLLCPRGAAWLVLGAGTPLPSPAAPHWKSTAPPYGYFGGDLDLLPADAGSLDTSPAWLAWVGATAALRMRAELDTATVEDHVTRLASRWRDAAIDAGFEPVSRTPDSHIVVTDLGERAPAVTTALADRDVKATVNGTVLRIGVHYFCTDADVDRAIDALR